MEALQAPSLRASPFKALQKPNLNPCFPNVWRLTPRPTKKFSSITASSPAISAPKREKDPKKRVVITGMGLVSVFGNDVDTYYDKLLAGESGIGPIDRFDASKFPTRFAGQIRGFTSEGYIDGKNDRRLDDCLRYCIVAGKKALEAAYLGGDKLSKVDKERTGVLVGTGMGGLTVFSDGVQNLIEKGYRKITPFFIPYAITNMGSALLAIEGPTQDELCKIRKIVSEMAGKGTEDVRVVVSPYRICPLGAHVDHQGGIVSAMTINKGILLGFVPSGDTEVALHSGQFKGEVRFRVNETQQPRHTIRKGEEIKVDNYSPSPEECDWGIYARGALYALQSRGNHLAQGIIGYICGSEGLDSSGLSSSAAVGVAYLLALESANGVTVSPTENIEYDRVIENEYLGLRNGILDQSAILLSSHGCLTYMNCKTTEHKLIHPPNFLKDHEAEPQKGYKILLAFSGLRQALTSNPGYNSRVAECQEAAKVLLHASGNGELEPFLCNVKPEAYEAYKFKLEPNLAKRAEHYFSENMRVTKGLEAWASGELRDFGQLMSASGLSSIKNYECGCEPLIQLYEVLLRAPGVFGARFSGAGFRGCCVALVEAARATEAANYVREEYPKLQPVLASQLNQDTAVLICEAGDCARVIF